MPRPKIDKLVHSKDSYLRFKKRHPTIDIDYPTFVKILQEAGKVHSQRVLEGGLIKLPNRLGTIGIEGKPLFVSEKGEIKLPINWAESKKLGKPVYHTNPSTGKYFGVEWKDYSYTQIAPYWRFIPNRLEIQRRIKDFVTTVKYYIKIKED